MPSTLGQFGIAYEERLEYTESWADDASMVTSVRAVDWNNGDLFTWDMLGYTERVGAGSGAALVRHIPERASYFDWLYCSEVQLLNGYKNHGQDAAFNDAVKFDHALYRCTFRAVPWLVKPDNEISQNNPAAELERYVERKRKFVAEQQKIPGARYVYDDGSNNPVPEVPARLFAYIPLEYTWKQIPIAAIPATAIVNCLNHTNAAIFDDRYAAETVLFLGVDERQYWSAAGVFVADLTFQFAWRADGWNKIPKSDGTLVLVKVEGSSPAKRIYDTADFNTLFTPA